MTNGRNVAVAAAIACVLSTPLAIGSNVALADELSDLRANQQLLQQRLDQLAQIPSTGGGYLGGVPHAGAYPGPGGAATAGAGIVGGSFPRSFLIPGTDTSIRVGGVITEEMDYWFNGGPTNSTPQTTTIGDNGVVLSVPLHGHVLGAANNARSRSTSIFSMTAKESKVNFETRTPTAYGEARTFMEFDWAGSGSFAPGGANPTSVSDNLVPRLRFAYATLGGFLAGQANSNFSDPDANGETIDFGGNVGEAGVVRLPQIRYTVPLAPWSFLGALSVSAETPETDGSTAFGAIASDGSPISVAPALANPAAVLNTALGTFFDPFKSAAPGLTAAWYVPQPWGHWDFSTVLRPALQVKDGFKVDRSYTGWGVHTGFDVKPGWFGWVKDDIIMSGVYGNGIGRYLNCSCSIALVTNYPAVAAATAAATFRSELSTSYGGELGYQHWWAPTLHSNANIGYFHQDLNSSLLTAGEAGTFNKELVTAHVNLFWNPVPFVTVGAEYMWGHRMVVNNLKGDENVLESKFAVAF
jgi:hypothetical protein